MDYPDQVTEKESEPRHNIFATIGLIFGILGVFTGSLGVAPILAIIFSSIGLSKHKRTGRGKIQSGIGLVLGFLYFLVFLYHQGYIR